METGIRKNEARCGKEICRKTFKSNEEEVGAKRDGGIAGKRRKFGQRIGEASSWIQQEPEVVKLSKRAARLCHGGGRGCGQDSGLSSGGCGFAVDLGLGALARDVAGLAAAVAGFSSRVERAAVGSGAVAGDVAELAAGIALHGLSLAVARIVIGTSTLVASGWTSTSAVAAAESAISSTHTAAAAAGAHAGVGTSTGKMAGLAASIAASAGGAAAQAQGRAVSLVVSKALAVIALLGLGSARVRAGVGLVSRLLAVVAQALRRRADLGVVADVAALVARTT
jgi:hypothetical protein